MHQKSISSATVSRLCYITCMSLPRHHSAGHRSKPHGHPHRAPRKRPPLPRLIAAAVVVLAVGYVCLATDAVPRLGAWFNLQRANGRAEQLGFALHAFGTVATTSQEINCAPVSFNYSCSGDSYVLVGTSKDPSHIKPFILAFLHSLGYVAYDNVGEANFVNFYSYTDPSYGGSINWDPTLYNSFATKLPPGTSRPKYLMLAQITHFTGAGLTEARAQVQGSPDPRKLPSVAYPPTYQTGTFTYINQPSNTISFVTGTTTGLYETMPLCPDYRVLNQDNGPLSISAVPAGMPVTIYAAGPCAAIISANMRDRAASEAIAIDEPASQTSVGPQTCASAGPALMDSSVKNVTVQGNLLSYTVGGTVIHRPLCPSYLVIDQYGHAGPITNLLPTDSIEVFHDGNVVTKLQVTSAQ